MITFEEAGIMLDEIADEMPEEFYKELNGGIILVPHEKAHADNNNLWTLGEYHNDRKGYGGLGRYITIYYGSFVRVYSHLDPMQIKEELRRVLVHEFTHHIESLAGDRSLEIKDAQRMAEYRRRYRITD